MDSFKIINTRVNHVGWVLLTESTVSGSVNYTTWMSMKANGEGRYAPHHYEYLHDAKADFATR